MAVFLVDFENLVGTNTVAQAMRGISIMNEEDTMYFFYSECCSKLKARYINQLNRQGSDIKFVKLVNSGKNALDFYIVTEVGRLVERGEKEIAVLSRDNGYRAVKDYLASFTSDVTFSVADSICSGFSTFKSLESSSRYNAFMQEEEPLSLNTLRKQSKKAIHNDTAVMKNKIVEVLQKTEFSGMTDEICEFAQVGYTSRIELYKAFIHQFGRKDGTTISRILSSTLFEK